ncbi:hypothetical protein [Actinomadura flavalba]|uniref:hypothetical protein n=1 Tax=Actinomadura flavalba TaxID=1120938 RepID=UPI0003686816|nr:hypothetical protein [Actinomadura flavalba]
MIRRVTSRDLHGLDRCPWGCEQPVRRTTNTRGLTVWVDAAPHDGGSIAVWRDGAVWRSRHLHRGESIGRHEQRAMIHVATCWRYAIQTGRPYSPPPRRLGVAPDPGGPPPDGLLDGVRDLLARLRRGRT